MINRLKRVLISRRVVTFLLVAMLLQFLAGAYFPQRFLTSPEALEAWRQANPLLARVSDVFELHRLYTSPLFALTLLMFSGSLALSCYGQIRQAWRKTFGMPAEAAGLPVRVDAGAEAAAIEIIRAAGYVRTAGNVDAQRFIRHPWGHWGKTLLHLGMVVVIVSSLIVLLTSKRGRLALYEGEAHRPGDAWTFEEPGLLSGPLVLPMSVRLISVVPEFWETDNIKQLSTALEFTAPDGEVKKQLLAINQTLRYQGLKIYQGRRSGKAFFVEFTPEEGARHGEILLLPLPAGRETAGYQDFNLPWLLPRLETKYYADAEKASMMGANPLLVLRLANGTQITGELSLQFGQSGKLGPYNARLVEVKGWGEIIFVESHGMPGIFLGFFIVILGGGLIYFTPPREVLLKKDGKGVLVFWKASLFSDFYQDEFQRLSDHLTAIRSELVDREED